MNNGTIIFALLAVLVVFFTLLTLRHGSRRKRYYEAWKKYGEWPQEKLEFHVILIARWVENGSATDHDLDSALLMKLELERRAL